MLTNRSAACDKENRLRYGADHNGDDCRKRSPTGIRADIGEPEPENRVRFLPTRRG